MEGNNKILLDDTDLKILYTLYTCTLIDDERITNVGLAKRIYGNDLSDYNKRIKNNFISSRLEKLSDYKLLSVEVESFVDSKHSRWHTKCYYLNLDFVIIKKCRFKSLGLVGKCIFIKINGSWNIFNRKFII